MLEFGSLTERTKAYLIGRTAVNDSRGFLWFNGQLDSLFLWPKQKWALKSDEGALSEN